jgi:hypothetical protein
MAAMVHLEAQARGRLASLARPSPLDVGYHRHGATPCTAVSVRTPPTERGEVDQEKGKWVSAIGRLEMRRDIDSPRELFSGRRPQLLQIRIPCVKHAVGRSLPESHAPPFLPHPQHVQHVPSASTLNLCPAAS